MVVGVAAGSGVGLLVGSAATLMVGEAAGVGERTLTDDLCSGPWTVAVVGGRVGESVVIKADELLQPAIIVMTRTERTERIANIMLRIISDYRYCPAAARTASPIHPASIFVPCGVR
jgi:hypothetical protein